MSSKPKVQPIQTREKLKTRNKRQTEFIRAINEVDFLFCDSVYGVGKTFLMCGLISEWLSQGRIKRAVMCRSTSHLIKQYGYSSGDYKVKSLEYFDQQVEYFYHFLGRQTFDKLWKDNIIELTGVELIRGRSFKNSLVTMDECQNCSKDELLLFLSRIDSGSKVILSGDTSQATNKNCFWERVVDKVEHRNVAKIHFDSEHILRHGDIFEISQQIRDIV